MTESEAPQSGMQFHALRLRSLRFELADLAEGIAPTAPKFAININGRHNDVTRQLEVDVTIETPAERPVSDVFALSLSVTGYFSWSEPIPFTVQQFMERAAPPVMWPYIRETVSSLTTRAGLPALLLPLVNFAAMAAQEQKAAAAPDAPQL